MAKYRQLPLTTIELSSFQLLFEELHIFLLQPPLIWYDKFSSIPLCSIPILHEHMKQLEVDYHVVCKKVVLE